MHVGVWQICNQLLCSWLCSHRLADTPWTLTPQLQKRQSCTPARAGNMSAQPDASAMMFSCVMTAPLGVLCGQDHVRTGQDRTRLHTCPASLAACITGNQIVTTAAAAAAAAAAACCRVRLRDCQAQAVRLPWACRSLREQCTLRQDSPQPRQGQLASQGPQRRLLDVRPRVIRLSQMLNLERAPGGAGRVAQRGGVERLGGHVRVRLGLSQRCHSLQGHDLLGHPCQRLWRLLARAQAKHHLRQPVAAQSRILEGALHPQEGGG